MRKKNSKNSKMKNTHSANNDMRQRKYFRARKKHSRHARSEMEDEGGADVPGWLEKGTG